MRLYRRLALELRAAGTDVVFALMGDGNMDLLVACDDAGIRVVHGRHEQHVVAMADGYSRVRGRPGLASVTHGPGLTQVTTSLVCAVAARSRVVILAGDTATDDPHHVQSVDQERLVTATGARSLRAEDPTALLGLVVGALRDAAYHDPAALDGPAPTVVHLPVDVQHHESPAGPAPAPPSEPSGPAAAAASIDQGAVAAAATLLRSAERPVVLAGRGAAGGEAPGALADLATLVGAPICTTLLAKGLLGDHALHAGVCGGIGPERAHRLVRDADVIVVVGASFNRFTTAEGRLIDPQAAIVQIDRAPEALGRWVPVDVGIVGDAATVLSAIAEEVGLPTPGMDARRVGLSGRVREEPHAAPARGSLASAADVLRVLAPMLGADPVLVVDGGHMNVAAATELDVRSPSDFVWGADLGTVGQGMGLAAGAAVAVPGRRVTLVCGDGGFLMSPQELDTMVREHLDVTMVVLDDGAYGQEVHVLAGKGHPTRLARFDTPDLAAIARGYGARSATLDIRSPESTAAVAALLAEPGPVVVHAPIDVDPPNPTIGPYVDALVAAGRTA